MYMNISEFFNKPVEQNVKTSTPSNLSGLYVPPIVKTRLPPAASIMTALIVAVIPFPGDELKDVAAIDPFEDAESIIDPAVIVTVAYVGV